MSLDAYLMSQIHHNNVELTNTLIKAAANAIIPALKTIIEEEAAKIANKYEPDSPFAADAAARLLLTEVAEFLYGSECDTPDQIVQVFQLTPKHMLYMQMPTWAEKA